MSKDMIERVADAIATVGLDSDGDNLAERQARAAIAAMREPTEAMIACKDDVMMFLEISPSWLGSVWQAMIDVALNDAAAKSVWRAMIDCALRENDEPIAKG